LHLIIDIFSNISILFKIALYKKDISYIKYYYSCQIAVNQGMSKFKKIFFLLNQSSQFKAKIGQRLNELTQKPPNSLNQRQIGSAFVVSSIFW